MVPPEVIVRLPPLVRVIAGSANAALVKSNVRLRRLVSPARLGIAANASMFCTLRSRRSAAVAPTVKVPLKSFNCVPSRMSDAATVTPKVAAPALAACTIAPVSVMLPPALTVNVPLPTLLAPRLSAPLLVSETLFAPLLLRLTAPVKLFAWFSVIALAPALKLAAPDAAIAPVCVIAPPALTVNVPLPTLLAPRLSAPALVSETLLAPLLLRMTAPVKAFAWFSVIALAPAVKSEVPGTVNTPVSVMAPPLLTVRFWPTVEAARLNAPAVVRLTLLAPLLDSVTAPVRLFAWFNVIALAPALKLEVPPTVSAALWVIGPLATTVRLPPVRLTAAAT